MSKLTQIEKSRNDYHIDDWGKGYYDINDKGYVECFPTLDKKVGVSLHRIVSDVRNQGIHPPLILRFPQITFSQIRKVEEAFAHAISEFSYQGRHYGVFPFKVNQNKQFIDNVVECSREYDYGLEVGSKAELLAALSYDLGKKSFLICNGFKDEEFIDICCLAARMGKHIVSVIEGIDELHLVFKKLRNHDKVPQIGFRVRLSSRGSGKWENSSGNASKFGLTTLELVEFLNTMQRTVRQDIVSMLHMHVGSQITEIKRFKNAIKEAVRIYSKVFKMGFPLKYLNIGGGMGVDYDGSKSSSPCSVNYLLQEFVNDAVYMISQICNEEHVPTPDIVSESGRIIAAYHSVLVTDIREVQTPYSTSSSPTRHADSQYKCLKELCYIHDHINVKNYSEYYHDAIQYHEELTALFSLGYLKLEELALGEELFQIICARALHHSSKYRYRSEEFKALQQKVISKYLANFSIFQSLPDAWSVGQLFPIMPLSMHQEEATHEANIFDITCDSDGCLAQFIDNRMIKSTIRLHSPTHEPYYLGFFLVGAYQESLANEHNLLGTTHAIEIIAEGEGVYRIEDLSQGASIEELLQKRKFTRQSLVYNFSKQLADNDTSLRREFTKYLDSYPYLKCLEK